MSNNPKKRKGLIGYGLEIVESVGLQVKPNPHNAQYLDTKREKMGHEISKWITHIHRRLFKRKSRSWGIWNSNQKRQSQKKRFLADFD